MKAVRLHSNAQSGATFATLDLPVLHREGPIDAEAYRRRATGEDPPLVYHLDQSAGLRTIRFDSSGAGTDIGGLAGPTDHALIIVVAGELAVTSGNGNEHFSRGDLLLLSEETSQQATFNWTSGTMLLQLAVDASWPAASPAEKHGDTDTTEATAPNLKRLYRDANARSYFREFPELFAAPSGKWSMIKPVDGFRFMSFPDGGFIDWHPEIVNNLAIVLAGVTELEAADGAVEHFNPGDVCLAEDRTGEGHIDRFHGFSVLALIEIATEHLW